MSLTALQEKQWNRWHVSLLFLFLVISVFLRWQHLSGTENGKFTWMSAHVLNTMKVWEKGGGPQCFHFAPAYTYPEEGNKHIPLGRLPGLFDANGNYYYVSYPPGGFLAPYYFFELVGWEKDLQHMRYFALLLHMFSALVFLFLLRQVSTPLGIAPLTQLLGGVLPFLFATVYLHYFLQFYFADLLFLPVFLMQVLAVVDWEQKKSSSPKMIFLLFILFFLGAMIDWMGWLSAAVFGGLVVHRIWKTKKLSEAWYLLPVMLAVFVAFGIMYVSYSSIAGKEAYLEVLMRKLFIRTGISGEELTSHGATLLSGKAWWYLFMHFIRGYGLFLLVFLVLVVVVVVKKADWKSQAKKLGSAPLVFLFLVVFLHTLLLFNFNALHDFSVMKTGLFLIVFGLLMYRALGEKMDLTQFNKVFGAVLLLALTQNAIAFFTMEKHPVKSYPEIAEKIKTHAAADEVVFLRSGMMYDPTLELLAERNVMLKMSPLSASRWLKEQGKSSGIFIQANPQYTDSIWRITSDGKKTLIFSHAQHP